MGNQSHGGNDAERKPPFKGGIHVKKASDKPYWCTLCVWVPYRGEYWLKFANPYCRWEHAKHV